MTHDEIIEMARKAGVFQHVPPTSHVSFIYDLMEFAAQVAAEKDKAFDAAATSVAKNIEKYYAMKEERDALLADAERYQWLKEKWTTTLLDGSIQMANSHGIRCKSFSEIDAVIDASRANYEY